MRRRPGLPPRAVATPRRSTLPALPYDLEGEFAHTIAAATFVAVLFVAAMRVQKLYSPNRLILMDDQARSVLSAWCGAFLILASGVFTWGVSHDLSRGDVLLFWALGAAALLAHRVFWWAALPRALESGALRGRTVVSLSCEDAIPQRFVENLTRHGYHIVAHFHVPPNEPFADEVIDNAISICRTSEIEEIVLFVDPERMSQLRSIAKRLRVLPLPVTFVPWGTLSQLFQRAHNDIGETVAIELQRAALSPTEQVVKRVVDIVVGSHLGLRISNFASKKPSNLRISTKNILTFDGSASLFVLVGLIGRLVDKRACKKTWIGLPGQARGFLRSSGT